MPEENSKAKQSSESRQAWAPAIVGGVAGAGIGLLANPQTGRRVAARIGESDMIRAAGREIRRTAQDIIMEQAMLTVRKSAVGYLEKYEDKLFGKKQEKKSPEGIPETEKSSYEAKYNELKEENKNINENLQRIEEKLNVLLDSKG